MTKNEIIQGNNLPKIEKIQGNNFLLSDEMLEKTAIIADFSPTLFRKIALSVETLLIQPEHHKNTSFWLNKEFNPARIG